MEAPGTPHLHSSVPLPASSSPTSSRSSCSSRAAPANSVRNFCPTPLSRSSSISLRFPLLLATLLPLAVDLLLATWDQLHPITVESPVTSPAELLHCFRWSSPTAVVAKANPRRAATSRTYISSLLLTAVALVFFGFVFYSIVTYPLLTWPISTDSFRFSLHFHQLFVSSACFCFFLLHFLFLKIR